MKLILILLSTILATSSFAESARKCTLQETKNAFASVVRVERKHGKAIYNILNERNEQGSKLYGNMKLKPANSLQFYPSDVDGQNVYWAGSIDYRNLEYNIQEGFSVMVRLTNDCKIKSHELFEISPE